MHMKIYKDATTLMYDIKDEIHAKHWMKIIDLKKLWTSIQSTLEEGEFQQSTLDKHKDGGELPGGTHQTWLLAVAHTVRKIKRDTQNNQNCASVTT